MWGALSRYLKPAGHRGHVRVTFASDSGGVFYSETPIRLALMLAIVLPTSAWAQVDQRADSARTALFSRHLLPVMTVELHLPRRHVVTGRLVDRRGDSLRIVVDRRLTIVELNQIIAARIQQTFSKPYGLIGGILGAVGLGTFVGFVGHVAVQEGASPGTFPEAIVAGVLLGGILGGTAGAVIGSFQTVWCPVDERVARRSPCDAYRNRAGPPRAPHLNTLDAAR